MSVKTIIACIEKSHAVMGAQIHRLTTIAPKLNLKQYLVEGENSPPVNVNSFLNTVVHSHLQGAADALLAAAEIENHINVASELKNKPEEFIDLIDVETSSSDTAEESS